FAIPSTETITAALEWGKQYFSLWLKVIRNPVEVLKGIDVSDDNSIVTVLKFVAFVYLLNAFIDLPINVAYGINLKNVLVLLTDFTAFYLVLVSFCLLLHVVAKSVRGKGTMAASFIACGYLSAYSPIISLGDYLTLVGSDTDTQKK